MRTKFDGHNGPFVIEGQDIYGYGDTGANKRIHAGAWNAKSVNGKLFAAAPDLLEELKICRNLIETLTNDKAWAVVALEARLAAIDKLLGVVE